MHVHTRRRSDKAQRPGKDRQKRERMEKRAGVFADAEAAKGGHCWTADSFGRLLASSPPPTPPALSSSREPTISAISSDLLTPGCVYMVTSTCLPRRLSRPARFSQRARVLSFILCAALPCLLPYSFPLLHRALPTAILAQATCS